MATATITASKRTAARHTERDPRWAAVVGRDARFDGKFVYAVKTSGVFCRPTCPSRRANPENVSFYASCGDAEQAGFRACRRCHPQRLA
jgi:AraC family transcriptional regulator, regulatory protein of adaptative response / methylated-DNA-[protein]-cysteine methyltransferase